MGKCLVCEALREEIAYLRKQNEILIQAKTGVTLIPEEIEEVKEEGKEAYGD